MAESVYIQMLGKFMIRVGDRTIDRLAARSPKGISLVEYLILQGSFVSRQQLFSEFWPHCASVGCLNSALKTLVSRTRSLLNGACPGLGACIVTEQNGYRWQNFPGLKTDVEEMIALLRETKKNISFLRRKIIMQRLLKLYTGDLFLTGDMNSGVLLSGWLHQAYIGAVYAYVDQLFQRENYAQVCGVCRAALRADDLDDRLNLHMMRAMMELNQNKNAIAEYRRVARRRRRDLDEAPSEEMQALYHQMIHTARKKQLRSGYAL